MVMIERWSVIMKPPSRFPGLWHLAQCCSKITRMSVLKCGVPTPGCFSIGAVGPITTALGGLTFTRPPETTTAWSAWLIAFVKRSLAREKLWKPRLPSFTIKSIEVFAWKMVGASSRN